MLKMQLQMCCYDIALLIVVLKKNHDIFFSYFNKLTKRDLRNMNHLHYQVSHLMKSRNVEQQLWSVYTFQFQWLNDLFH